MHILKVLCLYCSNGRLILITLSPKKQTERLLQSVTTVPRSEYSLLSRLKLSKVPHIKKKYAFATQC